MTTYTSSRQQALATMATVQEREELQRQQAVLVGRLDRGLEKIESARAQGADVSRWETLWVSLLDEYTACWDKLQAMGGRG